MVYKNYTVYSTQIGQFGKSVKSFGQNIIIYSFYPVEIWWWAMHVNSCCVNGRFQSFPRDVTISYFWADPFFRNLAQESDILFQQSKHDNIINPERHGVLVRLFRYTTITGLISLSVSYYSDVFILILFYNYLLTKMLLLLLWLFIWYHTFMHLIH